MKEDEVVVSLVLKNDAAELSRLAEEVDALADGNSLAKETRFELPLCLEEAATKVVNHGFDDMDKHDILVEIRLQDDGHTLLASIVDDGMELGYLDERDPELDAFLEARRSGGSASTSRANTAMTFPATARTGATTCC